MTTEPNEDELDDAKKRAEEMGEELKRLEREQSSKPFDYGKKGPDGQYENHPTEDPAGKKFVRPIRRSYFHLKCGGTTTMGVKIAETYALNPKYYGSTFCASCRGYFPVGENGQFVWLDENDKPTDQKVGT